MAQPGRLGRRLLPLAFVLCRARLRWSSLRPARRRARRPPASQPPQRYILVDADTGTILAASNEHEPHLTASTMKLLTALVALEHLPLDSHVPVSARGRGPARDEDQHAGGQLWKLDDALHSLLMVSANDAAYAIAERTSGSVEQFAKDANAVGEAARRARTRPSTTRPGSTTRTASGRHAA